MNCKKEEVIREDVVKFINSLIYDSLHTKEELAEMLGLKSPRVIYEWMNGTKLPNLINFVKLTTVLNYKQKTPIL